ncbi:unnamed protein product [Chilo suppressalis]|uniref:THAP-type domain-containing protein n=1 Tax=Chilo suppressalis TaxID=168631 RepID=A0ABN8L9H9_CHISP|nr:unnamed protein product [Chilo suppressalis]
MPNCSIVGCGNKCRILPNISVHRLPKNDLKRKMWLDTIGVENLKTHTKSICICSLHFEESCFNRTLNHIVLRDDAVPSRILLGKIGSEVNGQDPITSMFKEYSSNLLVESDKCQDPIPSMSNETTSNLPVQDAKLETIEKLNMKCKQYRKKVKRLNEKIRRQNNKITNYENIILTLSTLQKQAKIPRSRILFVKLP